MKDVHIRIVAVCMGIALLIAACGGSNGETIPRTTTNVTNPSPAPSNPAEPREDVNRTVAPNETPAPAETGTPGS